MNWELGTLELYTIIHDPNFFILGPNPQTMPRIMTIQNNNFGIKVFYIKTTEHVKMDLPAAPCESAPSYSLTTCITSSISTMIGCRTQWDRRSDRALPVCTEIGQLEELNTEYQELSVLEQMEIENQTGCMLPCRYKEYTVVDEPLTIGRDQMITLIRATKTVLIRTEVLVYPFSSFLAEFGGALGLFVGFSFMIL